MDALVKVAVQQIGLSGLRGCTLDELFGYVADELAYVDSATPLPCAVGQPIDSFVQAVLWGRLLQEDCLGFFELPANASLPELSHPTFPEETMVAGDGGLLCERFGDDWVRVDTSVYAPSAECLDGSSVRALRLSQVEEVKAKGVRYLLVASAPVRHACLGLSGGTALFATTSTKQAKPEKEAPAAFQLSGAGETAESEESQPCASSTGDAREVRIVSRSQLIDEQYALLEYVGKHGRRGIPQNKLFHCFSKKSSHIMRVLRLRFRLLVRDQIHYIEEPGQQRVTSSHMVWLASCSPPASTRITLDELRQLTQPLAEVTDDDLADDAVVPRFPGKTTFPVVLFVRQLHYLVVDLLQDARALTLRETDVRAAMMGEEEEQAAFSWRSVRRSLIESGMVKPVKAQVDDTGTVLCLQLVRMTPEAEREEEEGEDGDDDAGTPIEFSLERVIYNTIDDAGTIGSSRPEVCAALGLGSKLVNRIISLLEKRKAIKSERVNAGRQQVLKLYTLENYARKDDPQALLADQARADARNSAREAATQAANGTAGLTQDPAAIILQAPGMIAPAVPIAASQISLAAVDVTKAATPKDTVQRKRRRRAIVNMLKREGYAMRKNICRMVMQEEVEAGLRDPDGPKMDARTIDKIVEELVKAGIVSKEEVTINDNLGQPMTRELVVLSGCTVDPQRLERQLQQAAVFDKCEITRRDVTPVTKREVIVLDAIDSLTAAGAAPSTPKTSNASALSLATEYGYIRQTGERTRVFHRFVLSHYLPEVLPDNAPSPEEVAEICHTSFNLMNIIDAMPVFLYLQVIGYNKELDGLREAKDDPSVTVGHLPSEMRAALFSKTSKLHKPLDELVGLGLVVRSQSQSAINLLLLPLLRFRCERLTSSGETATTWVTFRCLSDVDSFWQIFMRGCLDQAKKAALKRRRVKAGEEEKEEPEEEADVNTPDVPPQPLVFNVANYKNLHRVTAWPARKLLPSRSRLSISGPYTADDDGNAISSVHGPTTTRKGTKGGFGLLVKRRRPMSLTPQVRKRKRRRTTSGPAKKRQTRVKVLWKEEESKKLLGRVVSYRSGLADEPAEASEEQEQEVPRSKEWEWVAAELPFTAGECRSHFQSLMKNRRASTWVELAIAANKPDEITCDLPASLAELESEFSLRVTDRRLTSLSASGLPSSLTEPTDTPPSSPVGDPIQSLMQDCIISATLTPDELYEPSENRRLLEQYGAESAEQVLHTLKEEGIITVCKGAVTPRTHSVQKKIRKAYNTYLQFYSITDTPATVKACLDEQHHILEDRSAPNEPTPFSESFFGECGMFFSQLVNASMTATAMSSRRATRQSSLKIDPMGSGGSVATMLSLLAEGELDLHVRVTDGIVPGTAMTAKQLATLAHRVKGGPSSKRARNVKLPKVAVSATLTSDEAEVPPAFLASLSEESETQLVQQAVVPLANATGKLLAAASKACPPSVDASLLATVTSTLREAGHKGSRLADIRTSEASNRPAGESEEHFAARVAAVVSYLCDSLVAFRVYCDDHIRFVAADFFKNWAIRTKVAGNVANSMFPGIVMRPWVRTDGTANMGWLRAICYRMLHTVTEHPGLSLAQLSEVMPGLDKISVLQLLRVLEEEGCINCQALQTPPTSLFSEESASSLSPISIVGDDVTPGGLERKGLRIFPSAASAVFTRMPAVFVDAESLPDAL